MFCSDGGLAVEREPDFSSSQLPHQGFGRGNIHGMVYVGMFCWFPTPPLMTNSSRASSFTVRRLRRTFSLSIKKISFLNFLHRFNDDAFFAIAVGNFAREGDAFFWDKKINGFFEEGRESYGLNGIS